jgi:xanthine/uracil permease
LRHELGLPQQTPDHTPRLAGIASRIAFAAAGILLIFFGAIGKLSAAIASIPGPVIGGVFAVLCAGIAINGFRVVRAAPLTERNLFVIGLPILMALFATLIPQDYVKTLPNLVQYLLGSSIAFGAVWAIVLNQILPDEDTASRSVPTTSL